MLQLVFWLPAFQRNAAGEVKNACSTFMTGGVYRDGGAIDFVALLFVLDPLVKRFKT